MWKCDISGSEFRAVMPNKDHCCMPKCQNNRAKNIADLTFHQFPKDKALKRPGSAKFDKMSGNLSR